MPNPDDFADRPEPDVDAATEVISGLIGVYHAEGSLSGELRYWIGARLGRAHCALCDVTHGLFREKEEWRDCRSELPVPFETVHLDERSAALVAVTQDRTPCVVAEVGERLVVLLGPAAIEACDGDPVSLVEAIVVTAGDHGLAFAE